MEIQGGKNRDYFLIKNESFRATLDTDGMFAKSALKKFTNNIIIEDHKLKPPKKIPYDSRPHKIFESLLITATETWKRNAYAITTTDKNV
jgi:hypothetical protein